MKKYLFAGAFLLLLASGVWAQAQKNMNLLGHLAFPDDCADVMGYVGSGGTEYAIIGHENGVGIVSLATPTNPVLLQDLPGINTIWREIDVYQNFAYVVNEGGSGMRIINLTNLPGTVTYKDTVIDGMTTGHTLFIEGTRLYVYGSNVDQGVSVFSLTNPWKPNKIGSWNQLYVHDAYVRNNVAYLSHVYDGLMQIVDFTNLNAPQSLGSVTTPSNFTHNTWLNDAGTVCFTTDEVTAAWIAAYDITTPSNIVEIDRYKSSLSAGQSIPHNVKVLNDFLVNAYYRDGVNITDASRPHNLIEVGYYDTDPTLSGDGFDGVWGLDCYLPSGNVIASDINRGLYVLGATYVRACYLEGIVTDLSTGSPLNGSNVEILTTTASDLSDATGDYATGVADAGTYSVTYSKFGYYDSTFTVNLSNGVLVTQNVPLRPIQRVAMIINVVEAGSGNPIPNAALLLTETSVGAQASYTANGSGQVSDPNFIAGTYSVIGGKWGWVTQEVVLGINQPTNTITVTLPKGYYDDYALDLGWIQAGNASSGAWERGEPIGTYGGFGNQEYNPENDITGDLLDQCYVTGNGGGAIGDDDVDAGSVTLRSPVMDLTTYSNPVLRYYRWFANGGGNGGPNDTLRIELHNGNQTAIIKRVYGTTANHWVQDSFIVSNFIPLTNNMDIRFIATDYPAGHVVEAAVDGFDVVDRISTATGNALAINSELSIFPNPLTPSSVVRYSLGEGMDAGTFELRDALGKLVYAQTLSQNAGQFQLKADLATGAYIGTIKADGKTLKVLKVMR